jgi:uroporphyrinogen-III synthase
MSLAGRGVVVTRPAELARTLAALIESAGGRALVFPAVEIVDLPPPAALERLAEFHLAIFVSPTAVARALALCRAWPRQMRVAAVGEGTRRALERQGFANVISPQAGADSEALLALPEFARFAGDSVLIVRGAGGRELLGQTLAERGARVAFAECYRRERPRTDLRPLLEAWERGEVHAVTAFSSEAVDNLAAMLGEERLQSAPLFASHARIAEQAKRRGLQALTAGPGDDDMVRRLVAYFDERY